MSVEKIMTKPVTTVDMDDPIKVIKDIFENTQFHHIAVLSGRKLVGIISDRDLLKVLSPNIDTIAETRKDLMVLQNKKAHQIMTRDIVTLSPDSLIYDAIEIFDTNHQISCIPIINEKYYPVGIVTWHDIIRAIAASHPRPS